MSAQLYSIAERRIARSQRAADEEAWTGAQAALLTVEQLRGVILAPALCDVLRAALKDRIRIVGGRLDGTPGGAA